MGLEERIIKRWQEWSRQTDKQFEPSEKTMKELIDIALEEVQRGMVEPQFTTKEAIALEHALDTLRMATQGSFPTSDTTKLEILKNLITPDVLSALGKLEMHLDDIHQAQMNVMALGADVGADVGARSDEEVQ
jgi:hypothetical protein